MIVPFVKDHFYEFEFLSQRSRGPGGQNVNKTNSSVQLRWNYLDSLILSDEQKKVIQKKLTSIINTEDTLFLRCDTHRDLDKNKKEVLNRLQDLLIKAFHKPKLRKPTKPTKNSQKKRVESKRHKSEIKKGRQGQWY
ncbi:aminoacyl-tRNA hydrolase [bacterium]|nr:aminoacyl-tRNA hydrolase [bacterium]